MAGVRSTVMQDAEAAPAAAMSVCGDMSSMSGPMHGEHGKGGAPHETCAFCSAAAHAPICGTVAPIVAPMTVRYIAWRAHRPLGPRGPPAVNARARGPPAARLTA
ncbi:MAG: hypothetical protein JWQ97_2021 [Phenylobacterium sp.]|nr:hypothetical protein [Phenylobacterium sp.]